MESKEREWVPSLLAALAAVGVHVALVTWLAGLAPPMRSAEDAVVLDVMLLPRRSSPVADERPTPGTITRAEPHAVRPALSEETSAARADASAPDAGTDGGAKPLDLRVPSMPMQVTGRDPLERRLLLEPRATRFERAWVPDGDALRQAAFRSPVVAAAVGLLGGPPEECDEVERRLRKKNCLPLHGDAADDEALRRSLDE